MPSRSKFDPTAESKRWMLYAVLIALVAWVGLWGVVQLAITPVTKALFFFLLFVSVVTTMMPPIAYLNARFGKAASTRTYRMRYVRESVWCALFIVVVAWLQMRRVLGLTLALILIAVFFLVESFLIMRETPESRT